MSGPVRAALLTLAVFVILYLTLPLLITIPLSLSSIARISFPPPGLSSRWYEELLGIGERSSVWVSAAWQSLQVGVATSILSTILGGLAAVPIARSTFRGKSIVETSL